MPPLRRYAEGTVVSADKSRAELTTILDRHGCKHMAWSTTPEADTLQFMIEGSSFRFIIRRPTLAEMGTQARVDAEWRRRWRAHVMLLKAKLEFIEGGDTTLEQEFMPNLLVDGGRTTLGDWVATNPNAQRLLGAG